LQAARHEPARPARSRDVAWALTGALALLWMAAWLNVPRVQYLALAALATAGVLLLLPWVRGPQRRWGMACAALLAAAVALGVYAQTRLHAVETSWTSYRDAQVAAALARLRGELDDAAESLDAVARDALAANDSIGGLFDRLGRGMDEGSGEERGVVLYERGRPVAWGGRMRLPPDSLDAPIGVAASTFYLVLYASANDGDRRAVATLLLDAAAPADRLAQSLAERVSASTAMSGFRFTAPAADTSEREVLRYAHAGRRLFDVRPAPLRQGEVELHLREQARIRVAVPIALALACFIIAVWRSTRSLRWRLAALGAAVACTALVPLNEFSNFTRLFNPALYYSSLGGQLTANAGALGITSAFALLGVLAVARRHRRRTPRWQAAFLVLLVAGLGPFLLRDLARGIRMPASGVSASLWLIWEVPLFLAAVSVLLAGAAGGGALLGRSRGLPPLLAPLLAMAAAMVAPVVWGAPGQWPWWYTFLWIGAIGTLALSQQSRFVIVSAATVAALGATTLVWGRTARGRVELAQRDLTTLREPDRYVLSLLDRFGDDLADEPAPDSRQALLQHFVASDLAAAGYPTALFAWPADTLVSASLQTADFSIPMGEVRRVVERARQARRAVVDTLAGDPGSEFVLAVPGNAGGVTAVVVAPRTRLIAVDPFARLLGLEGDSELEPLYTVQLVEPTESPVTLRRLAWRRAGNELHGDLDVRTGGGDARAHVEVELRPIDALVQRGALIVLLDLAIVALLWLVSVIADGGFGRWLQLRRRTWGRSFRTRLTLALFAFFVIPAAAFAVWSYRQLLADARQSRELLVRETLRAVAPDSGTGWIADESDRLETPLLMYRNGELQGASDPLYNSLAPLGRFLDPRIERELVLRDEVNAIDVEAIGDVTTLVGYRAVSRPPAGHIVLAAPARADELTLGRRRRDLGVLVLFATAVGALAALWLSGIAARQLARPIGSLRQAALALAAGDRAPPLEGEPTAEFRPVFAAFRRMASDLNASRTALEEAQQRTAAILRNVASGVVAVDERAHVSLANPRADALLGVALPPGTDFARVAPPELVVRVRQFLADGADDEAFELESGAQQLRGRLTRLGASGAVLTIDDVSALARAQRVLAWGEMARQVAHEIKNPLTPIRLGVQHLKRARADDRVDFDRVLEQNVGRILTEIDRLDEIARAFSRYGSAPQERAPAEPVDVAAVVRDMVALETMGASESDGRDADVRWRLEGADAPLLALARAEELREVLLNIFENARLAGARDVLVRVAERLPDGRAVIAVRDDGSGIDPEVLPRIFEPHFSTRTSGSGLGLAISRRLIEGWGGEIAVASEVGKGTMVTIRLQLARAVGL
jgi:two-component system nitrogen regulation sensor histidine kinase NtrY